MQLAHERDARKEERFFFIVLVLILLPLVRLFGADGDSAYFEHATSTQPVVCDEMDTLVLALGHTPAIALEEELADYPGRVVAIGDLSGAAYGRGGRARRVCRPRWQYKWDVSGKACSNLDLI